MSIRKYSVLLGLIGVAAALAVMAAPRTASADPVFVWATDVESFSQGLQANGNPVPANRSHPENALGAPTAPKIDGVDFVSLGMGGSIVLSFDTIFSGEAAIVWETTYENIRPEYPEAAELYISKTLNPGDFVYITTIPNTNASTTVNLSDYVPINDWFKYVMLVDVSDPIEPIADGFDVNAVGVVPAIPLPAAVWAGMGLLGLLGAARSRRTA